MPSPIIATHFEERKRGTADGGIPFLIDESLLLYYPHRI